MNGQRTAAGSKDYSWNVAGELATSNTPSGSYRYDPEGLRVGMILGTGWRRYSWDDPSGVGELISDNRAGGETFSYVYGPDGMPCEQLDTNGGTTTEVWLHQDATGSVRLSTDSAGNQTSTQSYDPWGNVTATTGTPPQLGYNSEPVDPTGLIYLQARYYDPTTGQFLTRDPAFTATLSAYGYTGNDPVNGSDPTGLICGKTFGSGTYNPACLTSKGYLQNCTGSECPAHCPVAKCPHANEQLPGAGKTSYYPCPPTLRGSSQSQNDGESGADKARKGAKDGRKVYSYGSNLWRLYSFFKSGKLDPWWLVPNPCYSSPNNFPLVCGRNNNVA